MNGGMRGFADLLAELVKITHDEFVIKQKCINTVLIYDSASLAEKFKADYIPSLIFMPISESHGQGPMSNTARQSYTLRLRLLAKSQDPTAYLQGENKTLTNAPELNYRVREFFYAHKQLEGVAFEMNPEWNSTYLNVVDRMGSSFFTGVDTILTYTKLEQYTGMVNEQQTLTPPFEF